MHVLALPSPASTNGTWLALQATHALIKSMISRESTWHPRYAVPWANPNPNPSPNPDSNPNPSPSPSPKPTLALTRYGVSPGYGSVVYNGRPETFLATASAALESGATRSP